MPGARPASAVVLALLIGGCTAGASPDAPSPTAVTAVPAARIPVKLTDALRMEPAQLAVPVGRLVTFVVTNAGTTDHEFFIGDEAAQSAHETEMSSMGGMGGMIQDELNGIGLKAGETKELTITFAAAGGTFAGCHVTGHYAAGMRATVTVGP